MKLRLFVSNRIRVQVNQSGMANPGGTNSPASQLIAIGKQIKLARCSGSNDAGLLQSIGEMTLANVAPAGVAVQESRFYRPDLAQ